MKPLTHVVIAMILLSLICGGCSKPQKPPKLPSSPIGRLEQEMREYIPNMTRQFHKGYIRTSGQWSREHPDTVTLTITETPHQPSDDIYVNLLTRERERHVLARDLYYHFKELRARAGYSEDSSRDCEAAIYDGAGNQISVINRTSFVSAPEELHTY